MEQNTLLALVSMQSCVGVTETSVTGHASSMPPCRGRNTIYEFKFISNVTSIGQQLNGTQRYTIDERQALAPNCHID